MGQGYETLTEEDAQKVRGANPDSHKDDLFHAIERGEYPSWKVCLQIMTDEQAKKMDFDIFDLTKVWSHKEFPLIEVGEMTLNRNPQNYFAEVEQLALSPGNLVPGIGASPDPMLQIRLIAYTDAANYRLGVNHYQLPVNAPVCPVSHKKYRDGLMNPSANSGGHPNYQPNSMDKYPTFKEGSWEPPLPLDQAVVQRKRQGQPDDVYFQPRALFQMFEKDHKERVYKNVAGTMKGIKQEIIERQLEVFGKVDAELEQGIRVALEQEA